jgi:hypothetical protein
MRLLISMKFILWRKKNIQCVTQNVVTNDEAGTGSNHFFAYFRYHFWKVFNKSQGYFCPTVPLRYRVRYRSDQKYKKTRVCRHAGENPPKLYILVYNHQPIRVQILIWYLLFYSVLLCNSSCYIYRSDHVFRTVLKISYGIVVYSRYVKTTIIAVEKLLLTCCINRFRWYCKFYQMDTNSGNLTYCILIVQAMFRRFYNPWVSRSGSNLSKQTGSDQKLWKKVSCGPGSVSALDPDSITLWIRIRNELKGWIRIESIRIHNTV